MEKLWEWTFWCKKTKKKLKFLRLKKAEEGLQNYCPFSAEK